MRLALVPYKGALKVPARGRYYHYVSDHSRLQRILCYVLLKPPVTPVTTLLGLLIRLVYAVLLTGASPVTTLYSPVIIAVRAVRRGDRQHMPGDRKGAGHARGLSMGFLAFIWA